MNFDAYGGAINRVGASDTAFVHRNTLACIQFTASIDIGESSATTAASQAWLDQICGSVHADLARRLPELHRPDLDRLADEYYGANLARLQQVKQAVDPDDFFHFAQSIPLP